MRDDRGVSEIVGFVIVFGIIIGSVGILSVVGFQSMDDYQQGEQMQNAERAFDALADNFNDIQRNDGIQTRASEINLREGTISVEDGTELTIAVDGSTIWSDHLGSFTYEKGDTTIAYEGGGVFRGQGDGSIEVKEPMLKCGDNAAIVSLVNIEGDPPRLQSTDGREIEASKVETEVWTGDEVDVVIEDSDLYENGWERVLDRKFDGGNCDDVDRVTVRITTIEIDY